MEGCAKDILSFHAAKKHFAGIVSGALHAHALKSQPRKNNIYILFFRTLPSSEEKRKSLLQFWGKKVVTNL